MSKMPPDNFFRANDLMNMVSRYLPEEDSHKVREAFILAGDAHQHVVRLSGEPYITHPLEVARILADMGVDADTLCAALLHDVIEDTHYTHEDIEARFGCVVADLVDGVTKLEGERFADKQAATIASFQKLMTAMTGDFRVVLIKLADRLHNMRTLEFKKPAGRRRIAQETMAIYVPLARRLGMNSLRRKMQSLAFEHLHPWRSQVIQHSLDRYLAHNKEVHEAIFDAVLVTLRKNIKGSNPFILKKKPFTIYERIKRYGKRFDEKREPLEIRVLVGTVDECYRAMGIIHGMYQPKLNGFQDFISTPKTYGFQALQTTVYTPSEQAVRFQIQTRSMYHVARYGITAQWRYPDLNSDSKARITHQALDRWLDQVRELGQKADSASEFYSDMKADLFLTEIYAFTPMGDVKEFPRGATVLDYAYAIHTEVGDQCTGALIDGEIVPLRTRIPNGATIEVITDPLATPKPAWLKFTVTARARSHIRNWLRQQKEADWAELGQKLFDQALRDRGSQLSAIDEEALASLLRRFKLPDAKALYLAIARAEHCSRLLADRLLNDNDLPSEVNEEESTPILIKGSDGMLVHYSDCCYPLPGEPVLAQLNPDRGLEVHRDSCQVLMTNAESHHVLAVDWTGQQDLAESSFFAKIETQAHNVPGVLYHITELLQQLDINVEEVNTGGDQHTKEARWLIRVRDLAHLDEVIRLIEHVPSVLRVRRSVTDVVVESTDPSYV